MSTTTTTPDPPGAPRPAPTDRPRMPIPTFVPPRPFPPAEPITARTGASTTSGPETSAPRPEGTHPGPGRESPNLDYGVEIDDEPRSGPLGLLDRMRDRPGRLTSSSTGDERGRPTVSQLSSAIGGVLAVLAAAAAWSVSKRRGWALRVPDEHERTAVSLPLARILERHVGTAFLTPDLVDGVAAAQGVAAYTATAPLYRTSSDDRPTADPFNDDLPPGYERP